MIAAVVYRGALERVNIFCFGDHAHERTVTLRIAANVARIVFGDRKTARAQPHAILERNDRFGECLGVSARPVEEMKDEPRGRLGTDRGKFRELVDEGRDGPGDCLDREAYIRPGRRDGLTSVLECASRR